MSQLVSPVQTVDCKEYFERVMAAGEDATEGQPSLRFSMAGQCLSVRFSCPPLERQFLPALRHLLMSSPPVRCGESSELTLTVWGGISADRVLQETPWEQPQDMSVGVTCVQGRRGTVTWNHDTNMVHVYDRTLQVGSVWVPDVDHVILWERAAPFAKILNWWLADQGVSYVHSAAVGTSQGAVLIVGRGGSGKSTLTLSSLSTSLQCLGDDYVGVRDGDQPTVFSLFNSAKLEPSHLDRHFPEYRAHVQQEGYAFGDKSLLFLSDTHSEKLLHEAPLKAIFVPRITDDAIPSLTPCGAAEAFRALAPSTMFQLPGNLREKFAALTQLTRVTPAYRLHLSPDLDRNIRLVEQSVKG